ncbi:30S ribosomal protein S30e [Candidatus Bathyarchaeota archaeon ex4484_40]|nr:MAG: 30S ribosomal protein S30e [Candidatus Bathyarchaeota archaeon ex4484_40]
MPTHGSLSKAGKVRSQTPKIEPRPRRKPIPRIRNRRSYEKRVRYLEFAIEGPTRNVLF